VLFLAGGVAGVAAVGWLLLPQGGKNRVKIVTSMPRTGSAQSQTDAIVNGIQMAIDDYGGEIAGMQLQHVDMDDATASGGRWDAGMEMDNARQAIADKDVMVFIGPYNSGAAKVSMPLLNEAGLLQISPSVTWLGLTKKVPGLDNGEPDIYRKSGKLTFCRVCPTDDIQGPLTARYIVNELKAKTVYILDDNELYGKGVAGLFKAECEKLGLRVLGHQSIVATQLEFKGLMNTIAALNPDVLYFGGTTLSKGPQIAIDMKGVVNCPLFVPDGCYEEAFIKAAGADVLNGRVYATMGGKVPSQLKGPGAEFLKRYKAKYNSDPESYALYGYEAAKVFLEAVKKVGKKDREAIRKAVLETQDFDKGVLGKWGFNADGDTTLQELTISKIVDGKFVPVPRD